MSTSRSRDLAARRRHHLYLLAALAVCSAVLPAQDLAPVRVFILAGQSNMQGQGVVDLDHPKYYNGGKGTLLRVMKNSTDPKRYAHLKDKKGDWVVRDDALRGEAVDAVAAAAAELGFQERARVDSRLAGPKGNREIFLLLAPRAADAGTGFANSPGAR